MSFNADCSACPKNILSSNKITISTQNRLRLPNSWYLININTTFIQHDLKKYLAAKTYIRSCRYRQETFLQANHEVQSSDFCHRFIWSSWIENFCLTSFNKICISNESSISINKKLTLLASHETRKPKSKQKGFLKIPYTPLQSIW